MADQPSPTNSDDDSFDDPDGVMEPKREVLAHTALKCLALIGRHHGVDMSVERMIHDYSLEDEEPQQRRILRMAKDSGFKVKATPPEMETAPPNGARLPCDGAP